MTEFKTVKGPYPSKLVFTVTIEGNPGGMAVSNVAWEPREAPPIMLAMVFNAVDTLKYNLVNQGLVTSEQLRLTSTLDKPKEDNRLDSWSADEKE